ncbi:hypothetical protein JCM3774_002399 [Rhodotorula dairenensis]
MTPGRARRMAATPAGTSAADTFKKPTVPSSRKAATGSRTPSRNRPLSQSTSGETPIKRAETPDTVKPATRTSLAFSASLAESSKTTPRKKAVVGGEGGAARVPSSRESMTRDLSSSRGSRDLSRSTSGLAAGTRTPLRASTTSTLRGASTTLSTLQSRRTLTVPSTGIRGGETAVGAATVPRKAGTLSAIPVPTTQSQGSRTLQRPPSVLSTASSRSATSSTHVSADRAVLRASGARPSAGLPSPPSGTRPLGAALQTDRKSSWETVPSSARTSLAASQRSRRRSSVALPGGGDADRSWETVESRRTSRTAGGTTADVVAAVETPRRQSQPGAPTLVSPLSSAVPGGPPTLATTAVASPEYSSTLLQFSHAAFLSPMPAPPANVLGDLQKSTARPIRSRPRESTTLDELLRLGMLNQPRGALIPEPGMEVELLLDEGSSRVMTEELRNSLGPPTSGNARGVAAAEREGASTASPAPPTTPWRGRIVSVGGGAASAKRRSLATSGGQQTLDSVSEDAVATMTSPPPSGQVLLLRQSTAEASDLRRQLAALSAELERVKRERDEAAVASSTSIARDRPDDDNARVEALRQELEAAQARESELRSDWEAERRSMEEDMAELAAAAAAATFSTGPASKPEPVVDDVAPAVTGVEEFAYLRLRLTASESAGASLRAGSTFAQAELLAKREREETRLAIATLQAVARGLDGWRSVLLL